MPPTAPVDKFGPIVSLWPIAEAVATDLHSWMPEYLAAHERQNGIVPGTTPRLNKPQVRHAAIIRPEEQTPACVVWLAGTTDHTRDPDGTITGTLQFGVMLVAASRDTDATGDLLHRYAAAAKQIIEDRSTLAGYASRFDLVDEDYTPFEAGRDRVLLGIDLSYSARDVRLGIARMGPPRDATPRDDPTGELPPAPTALTTHLDPEERWGSPPT